MDEEQLQEIQFAVMRAAMEALSACYHAGLQDVPELAAAHSWLYKELHVKEL